MSDPVDHPPHYSRWKMEPIEFIAINDLPWWLANVIKYCTRYDAKDGLKDLYKARSYLEMKIRQLEGYQGFWKKPVAEERHANAVEQTVTEIIEKPYPYNYQPDDVMKEAQAAYAENLKAQAAVGPIMLGEPLFHCRECGRRSNFPLSCDACLPKTT